MAITFYQKLDDICCAYNNNIVKFKANGDFARIYILHEGKFYRYEIVPLKDNFYFNFKEPFKMLFKDVNYAIHYNTGSLQDYESSNISARVFFQICKGESGLPLDVLASQFGLDEAVKKIKAQGNELELNSHILLRSAEKINDILSVMHTPTNNECHLTVWNGYPMDIAFFGKGYYLPSNLASDLPTPKQSKLKAQLYCLSDGTSVVPENQFTWGQTKIFTYLKDECGIYLKWINRYGGWDYHLFTNYTERHKNKDIFKIQEYNQEVTTGKIVTEQIELLAGAVSRLELEKLRGILYSSHVYLYTGKKGQKAKYTDWQLVRLDGSTSINNLTHSHNLKFTINLPNKNTITL